MKPDSTEEKPVTDDSGEFILRENSLNVNRRRYTRTIYMRKHTRRNKTRLTSDEMCRLYGTVCVVFRARFVFPHINDLTVYLIFSCLSFPQLCLLFLCRIFRLKTNFPCFPISLAAGKRGGETKGR